MSNAIGSAAPIEVLAEAGAPAGMRFRGRRAQPLTIRLNHWLNVLFIVLMAGSGIEIYAAYPSLGPRGAQYGWYPFQGIEPPEALTVGGWLAGARRWHFAIAWLLMLNGAIYLTYFFGRGEWRRRMFLPVRDASSAVAMAAYYLRIRKTPPPPDFYNGLQRFAYSSVIVVIIVQVLSGLAIYKPVQLHWLVLLFGGYDAARVFHLLGLVYVAMFALMHVVLVALHPRELLSMITGGARG
jgi:thiosulfate reductase cytochrome b subunit